MLSRLTHELSSPVTSTIDFHQACTNSFDVASFFSSSRAIGQALFNKRKDGVLDGLRLTLYLLLRQAAVFPALRAAYGYAADGDRQCFPLAWYGRTQV
eukprot:SAG31_NODE_476_length_15154_cov_24.796878_10_plen_98_part_00